MLPNDNSVAERGVLDAGRVIDVQSLTAIDTNGMPKGTRAHCTEVLSRYASRSFPATPRRSVGADGVVGDTARFLSGGSNRLIASRNGDLDRLGVLLNLKPSCFYQLNRGI